jgi:glutaminase
MTEAAVNACNHLRFSRVFHTVDRRTTENDSFVVFGLYRKRGRPYNPVIASGRGAKRRRAVKQATET